MRQMSGEWCGTVIMLDGLRWGGLSLQESLIFCQKQFKELGYVAPVINLNIDYKQVTKSDEEIIIRTHFEEPKKAALKFKYEVVRKEDKELLSRARQHR